jgi:hypothetical protein
VILVGWLSACGGSDFAAAAPTDVVSKDSSAPTSDALSASDADAARPDAAEEARRDDGGLDATSERVGNDATSVDESVVDVASEGATDAASESRLDAAPEGTLDAPGGATCDVPATFYRDRDGDGFGATAEHVVACVAPASDDAGAWVTQPGDCRDDLPDVKPFSAGSPDPPKYSGVGYPDPLRPQGVSFDFDCNGVETADPSNMFGGPPTCPALATGCAGTGYLPASPARTGAGVNALCGSTTLKMCVVQGLGCNEQYIQMATPFRCR